MGAASAKISVPGDSGTELHSAPAERTHSDAKLAERPQIGTTHVCNRNLRCRYSEGGQGAGPAREIMGHLTRFFSGPPYISYPYLPSRILAYIK